MGDYGIALYPTKETCTLPLINVISNAGLLSRQIIEGVAMALTTLPWDVRS